MSRAHVCVCVIRTNHVVLSILFYFEFNIFGSILPHPTDISIPFQKFLSPPETVSFIFPLEHFDVLF